MPQFSYRARRRSGELVEGVLDVADRSAAVSQIERLGLFPIAVDALKGGPAASDKRAGQKMDLTVFLPPALRERLRAFYGADAAANHGATFAIPSHKASGSTPVQMPSFSWNYFQQCTRRSQ